jgi:hypothetical protein
MAASTSGTYQMAGSLPAGAIVLGMKLGPVVGFAGDTTAVLTIGDGSDVDRYHTGTPTVFTTQAVGVDCGVPSGLKLLTARTGPRSPSPRPPTSRRWSRTRPASVTVAIYYVSTS